MYQTTVHIVMSLFTFCGGVEHSHVAGHLQEMAGQGMVSEGEKQRVVIVISLPGLDG